MSSLPTWAIYMTAIGSPTLALVGAVAGTMVSRKGAKEIRLGALEQHERERSEELGRRLRWAAEQATSPNQVAARIGIRHLSALLTFEGISDHDRLLIKHALDAVLEPVVAILDRAPETKVVLGPDPEDQSQPDGGGAP